MEGAGQQGEGSGCGQGAAHESNLAADDGAKHDFHQIRGHGEKL
jgi:hypothetical protein